MNNISQIEKKDIFKHGLIIGVILLLVLVIQSLLSGLIMSFLLYSGYSASDINNIFLENVWSGYLINTVFSVISFIFPFLIIKVIAKKPIYQIGNFNTPNNKFAPYCVGLIVGSAMAANIITSIFNEFLKRFIGFEAVQQSIGDNTYSSGFELFYSIIGIAVVPALVEEFAFRGMILGSLRKFGDVPAIIISSVLFAILHGNFVQIPFALIVGITLGITVIITDSIWPAVIGHFINNSYAIIVKALSAEFRYINIIMLIFVLFIGFGILSLVKLIKKGAFKSIKKVPSTLTSASKIIRFFSSPTVIIFILIMFRQALKFRA